MDFTKETTSPVVTWQLDDWCAKTLRSFSALNAEVFVRFIPETLDHLDATAFGIEFFGSDDLEYHYQYDE
jgi:hypothetical protein